MDFVFQLLESASENDILPDQKGGFARAGIMVLKVSRELLGVERGDDELGAAADCSLNE